MVQFTHFNYCPRCSSASIAVHMKNAIACSACGYVYFHNSAAAVAGIIEIDGSILLLKRAHEPRIGCLDLPGGFVDYGESLDAALVREVREECNLPIVDIRYFGSFPNTYHYREVTYLTADAVFLCRPADDAAERLALSEENSGYVLVKPGDVDIAMVAFDSARAAIKKYSELFPGI